MKTDGKKYLMTGICKFRSIKDITRIVDITHVIDITTIIQYLGESYEWLLIRCKVYFQLIIGYS